MNFERPLLTVLLLLLFTAVLVACSGVQEEPVEEAEEELVEEAEEELAEEAEEPFFATGSENTGDGPPSPPDTGAKVEVTRVAAQTILGTGEAVAIAPRGETATDVDTTEAAPAPDSNNHLKAGEVDDNAQWDDYLLYLRNYEGAAVIEVDVSERHQIWVSDPQGHPILGAQIRIEANGQEVTTLRTHSNGLATFFPHASDLRADNYTAHVIVNDITETLTISAGGSQREWFVTHAGAEPVAPPTQLDILFLIDATGSMADEINQLKENIHAIAAQIEALPAQPDVRLGMVAYRDRGDEFVTRLYDFTPDVEAFAADLARVYADGGGDYPEDLNEALTNAIHQPEWRLDKTVSLIFLVADAPPHLDYGQQNHYAVEMMEAARRGIKIFPVASSGLDSQGEYIFRQLAQSTGGRFIFLTYGPEGPGTTGTETEFEVSDYTVSSLDTLVVQIVAEELSYLVR